MKKIKMTYRELHDVIEKSTEKYFIKTPDGFSQILATCKKNDTTYIVEFDNHYEIVVGENHAFMNMIGEPVIVKDILPGEYIKTIDGCSKVISKNIKCENDEVFDISIDSPHWYTNSMNCGGIIHHNTMFSLIMAKSYMEKYPEAVMLFYDSEFGSPQTYFTALGINTERVIHTPIPDIEQLKFDIMKQLNDIQRDEKIIILVDSIGNLASKKEVEDALNEKSVADMTRSKALKSLFRMVTPQLAMKNIPMVAVNHTYKTLELYSKDVVSGGTGGYYSADNIYIIGRQQEKEGTDLTGYNFIINVEKSRYVREKSKIPITVSFEGGLSRWSGLLEIALQSGHVYKPSNGWYSRIFQGVPEDEKFREKATNTKEFWLDILKDKEFQQWIINHYQISSNELISEDFVDQELVDIEDDFIDIPVIVEDDFIDIAVVNDEV